MAYSTTDTVRSTVSRLFWSTREGRLRAFWRLVLLVGGGLVLLQLGGGLVGEVVDSPVELQMIATRFTVALGSVLLLAVGARWIDRRPIREYGFHVGRDWWTDFAAGAATGLVVPGGPFVVGLALGWLSIDGVLVAGAWPIALGLLAVLVSYLFVALWEEIVFRGVLVTNAVEGLAARTTERTAVALAVGGPAVLFGVGHFPQAETPISLLYWVFFGLLLGLAYVLTGELALPIGLHLTLNLGMNSVFGFGRALSGDPIPAVLVPELHVAESVFGIAGWLHVVFAFVGLALVLGWIRWYRGRLAVHPGLAEWTPRSRRD